MLTCFEILNEPIQSYCTLIMTNSWLCQIDVSFSLYKNNRRRCANRSNVPWNVFITLNSRVLNLDYCMFVEKNFVRELTICVVWLHTLIINWEIAQQASVHNNATRFFTSTNFVYWSYMLYIVQAYELEQWAFYRSSEKRSSQACSQ